MRGCFRVVFFIFFSCVVTLSGWGCERESVEGSDAGVGEGEVPEVAREVAVFDVPESRYDDDGVVRLSGSRYYNAVVPRGSRVRYCIDRGCLLETDLSKPEVFGFFGKYFPYQKLDEFPKVSRFRLHRTEADGGVEVGAGGVVPNLGGVVERPLPGLSVQVEVRWESECGCYLFEYFDPRYVEPNERNDIFLFLEFVRRWGFSEV